MTEIMLIGDEEPFRRAMSLFLEGPDLEIVGSFPCGAEALYAAREFRPDVLILDLPNSGQDGLSLIRELAAAAPSTALLVLAAPGIPVDAAQALSVGARGFLAKQVTRFQDAVRVIRHGGVYVGDEDANRIFRTLQQPKAERPYELTPRELEVLRLLADGRSNKVIGRELAISEQAVKNHVSHVLHKLGVTNRTAAAIVAYRDGFVLGPEQADDESHPQLGTTES